MEILYSQTIFAFLKKLKRYAKEILREEVRAAVFKTRFERGGKLYPLHLVVFEHPSRLGYFDASLYEIGVNQLFLLEEEEAIKNLLRHELAHYLTWIEWGTLPSPHGKEFHEICLRYGWSAEISKARVSIEKGVKKHQITRKVQKLLSLAESHHVEEAKAATLKARELLEKYQLTLEEDSDQKTAVRRILKAACSSPKLQAIASILRHFFVYPIFNRGEKTIYLEIVGSPLNVEIACYVGDFLHHHLERLWEEAKKERSSLKGARAKRAFFEGIAEGYEAKMRPSSYALVSLEKALVETVSLIYPHLSLCRQTFSTHEEGRSTGRQKGRELKIAHGVQKQNPLRMLALK